MNNELIEKLVGNDWREGNGCYFKDKYGTRWYYNIEPNTFSYSDSYGIEEYLCKATLEELEKIERGEY